MPERLSVLDHAAAYLSNRYGAAEEISAIRLLNAAEDLAYAEAKFRCIAFEPVNA